MLGTDLTHWQLVKQSILGCRPIDEQTFESIGVLEERLEQLKKSDNLFKNVTFSSDVQQLTKYESKIAIG